jgi:hypothetical protein
MPRVALLLLFFLAACSTDGDVSNPILRKFTWFSYVQGDDLRSGCAPGAPERYRLIYNANYVEQVRIYDLGAGAPNHMSQRVVEGGGIGSWELGEPFGPWRGRTAELDLRPDQAKAVVAALDAAGGFGPPAEGLELESRSFFWTLAACHRGRYHFTAWPQSAPPAFAAAITALDATGVPLNPPRIVSPPPRTNDPVLEFRLRVGANGLWGVP